MKCGFICARSACDSRCAIFLFSSVLRFSLFLMLLILNRIESTNAIIESNDKPIMNHVVLQNGLSIVKVKLAGLLFQTPSLLELMTLNVYVPGGKFEKVANRSLLAGDHFFSKPSRTKEYFTFNGLVKEIPLKLKVILLSE